MKYARGAAMMLVEDRGEGALYPEMMRAVLPASILDADYRKVIPIAGETVVGLTKRLFLESDGWWLIALLNDVIDPFAPLEGEIRVPDAAGMATIYAEAMRAASWGGAA